MPILKPVGLSAGSRSCGFRCSAEHQGIGSIPGVSPRPDARWEAACGPLKQ